MAQDERIAYFAALCEQLYNPKSSQERDQVQKMLEYSFPTFADEAGSGIAAATLQQQPPPPGMENSPSFAIVTPTDTASALRVLLESSPNPYVQTFCLSRLKQLVQAQFTIFSNETKLQLRKYVGANSVQDQVAQGKAPHIFLFQGRSCSSTLLCILIYNRSLSRNWQASWRCLRG